MAEEKKEQVKVTGIRLTESERSELLRIGRGSFTLAIRDALDLLFRQDRESSLAK